MGYKQKTIQGISWMTLFRLITRVLTFVRLAVLGRLLTPIEFGYFGIASLILSFLEIITETGINIFLIQRKQTILEYLNSAWVVSIMRGILLSSIILIIAPFITSFFNTEKAYPVILLSALIPFIRGFINPAIISFQKELSFNKEFNLRTALFFVDVIISIIVAFFTRSAISFTWGLIASAMVEVILSFILIPLWPKFDFNYTKVKHVIRMGWWVNLTGIFLYFSDNSDNFCVGKILGPKSLGIYQIAYKLSTLPITEITGVVNQVVFPIYVKLAENKNRLLKAFFKVSLITSIAAIILNTFIFFFAEKITLLVMGNQWNAAIPIMKILAIYGVFRTIFGNSAPLFLSIGKQEYVAYSTLARMLAIVLLIIPFTLQLGMKGAGYAMLISMFFEIPVIIYFLIKVFKFNIIKNL
jgi:O-antigen/teichoic acid export membrane protein